MLKFYPKKIECFSECLYCGSLFWQFSVGGVEGATAFFSHGNHKDRGNTAGAEKHFKVRKELVSSREKLCRAQQELHFQAATYLCLLRSVREQAALHEAYHGKGERSPEEVAGLVGFSLPQQPGGKG
ncbi:hypothetical protein A306_00004853 [Columba livia]|uniref:Protein FMC1 homolog n=1 Tax=Columba livia TaxID=8932 RepID=A0A2I0MJD5_COLLI|nr:hypothetical protein A306_00004853 [Columba livia]